MKKNKTGKLTWKEKFNKKYNFPKSEPHSLTEISKETGVSKKGIQQIYNKGIGAYKTNPQSVRPNVTSKEQWAMARVYSSVMGGKASKVDAKELKMKNGGILNNPNFKEWFGDSKVVDENGNPLVVYHGTTKDFDIYDKYAKKNTVGGTQRDALFFSNKPNHASEYAIPSYKYDEVEYVDKQYYGSNIMPIYLKINNPLEIDAKGSSWVNIFPEAIDKALDNNKDGVIVYNLIDNATPLGNEATSTTYVVFEPTQIKSAIGNIGEYDRNNPNITMEKGGGLDDFYKGYYERLSPSNFEVKQNGGQIQINMNKNGAVDIHEEAEALSGGFFKKGGETNFNPDGKIKDKIVHASGDAGGMLVGKRHSNGGIKALNKSTGQPLEMEGGEVVITRNAVSDNKKRSFNGKMLTNRQILSEINESGGGVSFADGGQVPNDVKFDCNAEYEYGGKTMCGKDLAYAMGGVTTAIVTDPNEAMADLQSTYGLGDVYAKGGLIPNVGTVDDFMLKELLMKNKKVLAILSDKEIAFMKLDNVDVIAVSGKNYDFIFTDGKKEFEIINQDRKLKHSLRDARPKIVEFYSKRYAKGGTIECGSCSWSWDRKDGGDDMYVCHKCGADNEPSRILNKSINASDSSGRKGLVSVSALEPFVGEDRIGDSAMTNSREVIDKLKIDIRKNGFKEPIIVLYDKFSNGGEATIIEGNHRFVVAKELGLKEIPVTFEKGTIRSDEKRLKDQMFPLKRKFIGKIDDTRGVRGADLGLEVRQPKENDFVKENSFAMGGKVYDYDSYTSFKEESNLNIQKGVQYILRGEYTLVARYLYLKDKEAFYYYKYLQRLNITLKDCNDFALSLNKVFSKMICDIQVNKTERKRSYAVCLVRSGVVKSPFYAQGLINNENVSLSTPIYMECCKGEFLERISNRPIPARDLKDYYSFQTLIHELAHSLDFQFQFSENKYPVIAHKDYFMETLYNIILACKNGSLPLAKSFGIRAKALKRISQITNGKI